MKKFSILLLITLLFASCVSTKSFDDNQYAGEDAPSYTEFFNPMLVSQKNETIKIYVDTYTTVLYYGISKDNLAPIIEKDGTPLLYEECQNR